MLLVGIHMHDLQQSCDVDFSYNIFRLASVKTHIWSDPKPVIPYSLQPQSVRDCLASLIIVAVRVSEDLKLGVEQPPP